MLRIFYVLLFQLRILMHDTFLNVHSQDMCITKNDLIDALLTVNDALAQTWIVDYGASFHVTPIKECFSTFTTQPWPCIPWKQSCMFH